MRRGTYKVLEGCGFLMILTLPILSADGRAIGWLYYLPRISAKCVDLGSFQMATVIAVFIFHTARTARRATYSVTSNSKLFTNW